MQIQLKLYYWRQFLTNQLKCQFDNNQLAGILAINLKHRIMH